MTRKVIRKATPVELIVECAANEGHRFSEGESRTGWLNRHYDVSVDHKRGQYVARRKRIV